MKVFPWEDLDGTKKKWVSYLYRTAQPSTLAVFLPWGIKQELVVQDLPATKVANIHQLAAIFSKISA